MDTTKGICKVCSHGFVLYKGFCKDCSVERGTVRIIGNIAPALFGSLPSRLLHREHLDSYRFANAPPNDANIAGCDGSMIINVKSIEIELFSIEDGQRKRKLQINLYRQECISHLKGAVSHERPQVEVIVFRFCQE